MDMLILRGGTMRNIKKITVALLITMGVSSAFAASGSININGSAKHEISPQEIQNLMMQPIQKTSNTSKGLLQSSIRFNDLLK
jgi:hypothetical protein